MPLRLFLPLLLVIPLTAQRLEASNNMSVSGDAVILVEPDQVVVTLGIEVREAQLSAAQAKFENVAKQVDGAIAALGINADQVRTNCLELAPYYQHSNQLVPEYFRINRVMAVTIKDTKLVDRLISGALTAGATHVHDVDFRTTELRKYRDEARRMAIRAARDKATLLIGEIGRELGKAQSIQEGHIGWNANNPYRARFDNRNYLTLNTINFGGRSAGDNDAGNTVIPPGQIAVTANVTVTFEFN